MDGGLHAWRWGVGVAADEGVAPGGEGAEGAVEAVVCGGERGGVSCWCSAMIECHAEIGLGGSGIEGWENCEEWE